MVLSQRYANHPVLYHFVVCTGYVDFICGFIFYLLRLYQTQFISETEIRAQVTRLALRMRLLVMCKGFKC